MRKKLKVARLLELMGFLDRTPVRPADNPSDLSAQPPQSQYESFFLITGNKFVCPELTIPLREIGRFDFTKHVSSLTGKPFRVMEIDTETGVATLSTNMEC